MKLQDASGYLFIADITGYTAFLSNSELTHARDSLDSLMGLLVDQTQKPLLVSGLEGDAVFGYAPDDDIPRGQVVVDFAESTYLAFRKARELMVINTTCDCNACLNIPNLDLKFFVHHGHFDYQKVGVHRELVGTDVILIHRLTKNSIVEVTGVRAYAAYTSAALKALELPEFARQLLPHHEQYEHMGQITLGVEDLNALWETEGSNKRLSLSPEDTLVMHQATFPLPPAVLWHYLTDPQHRAVIHGSEWQKLVETNNGRIGTGAVYECSHGTYTSRNTIVDWHPFEQYTTIETTPVPRTHTYVTYSLKAQGDGTRLTYRSSKAQGPALLARLANLGGRRILKTRAKESFIAFRAYLERQLADQRSQTSEVWENL